MGLADTDICRFCQDLTCSEDMVHLLSDCPAIGRARFSIWGTSFIEEDALSKLGTKEILHFISKLVRIDESIIEVFPE